MGILKHMPNLVPRKNSNGSGYSFVTKVVKRSGGRYSSSTSTIGSVPNSAWTNQSNVPVRAVMYQDGKKLPASQVPHYWVYKKNVYETHDNKLKPADVLALINEVANRRRLTLQKAHALQAMVEQGDKPQRQPISQDVKIAVWQRDGGRCVECDSNRALEFDHVIPLSMGGANSMRNLQLLCEVCNRRKGASLG